MKKLILSVGLAFAMLSAWAQDDAASYIIKTRNAQKKAAAAAATAEGAAGGEEKEEETATDFVGANFKFYSLCDWKEGMKFMVMPEKYDMIVNTFRDASTGKEVSSGRLRHKIMIYKSHDEAADGHSRIHFHCTSNNHDYYYEVPNGSFEDYCYGKMGVPTLAYLGDVDIAREKLMGQRLFTKATLYREDTEADGDGFREVNVQKNEEVKVVAVGVGTRAFPVKIIVEDKNGKEFYQNVAMSKTNCGMRDDEFIMDNTKFTFYGSFELIDGVMAVASDYKKYINKVVHTKYSTTMQNEAGGKTRNVKVPRLTEFTIESLRPQSNSNYVTLTLRDNETSKYYQKDVTFVNENVAGDIDGYKEDYFGYLFAMGPGKLRNTSTATRAMIRQGRVAVGMTEDEVQMAVGEPDTTAESNNGRYDWIYKRSQGKILIVQFGKAGKVIGTRVQK